jgi:hypothetical protein
VPPRFCLEGELGTVAEGRPDGVDRRRVDHDRARGSHHPWRRSRPTRRARTPASAGRTTGGGPWAWPTSCVCPGQPPGRRRSCARSGRSRSRPRARDLEGSCAASGVRGVVAPAASDARRAEGSCHRLVRRMVWAARTSVKRTAVPRRCPMMPRAGVRWPRSRP